MTRFRGFAVLAALLIAPPTASAQQSHEAALDEAGAASLDLFREFLSLPNDAHHAADILTLVEWLEPQFAARGFSTARLATDGSPILFAERKVEGAARTALVYLQADGQPVDPSKWEQESPWRAVLKEKDGARWRNIDWPEVGGTIDADWRVFARSASDSKGPMTQFLRALDLLKARGEAPAYNLKIIVDTEEELGSPNLAAAVRANRALLGADFLLIFDGPPHASNKPTVVFGARGISTITLTTYGPKTPQHSGHYGNFVPNPALSLAKLVASMKRDDGRVAIKGFYDGVSLSKEVKEILAAVPDDEEKILAEIGVAAADEVAPTLQQALQFPSLNIRGLSAGWVGDQARTIIPDRATAEIDIRTVKETDPERLIALVRRHVEREGFYIVEDEPSEAERLAHSKIAQFDSEISYGAFRSDFDSEAGRVVRAALKRLYGEEPILIRSHGGSIPIAPLVETLDIPAAIAPTVNIDNNQHSPNENIRLGDFFDGVERIAAVLTTPAGDD